jgi:hypothetical protein
MVSSLTITGCLQPLPSSTKSIIAVNRPRMGDSPSREIVRTIDGLSECRPHRMTKQIRKAAIPFDRSL